MKAFYWESPWNLRDLPLATTFLLTSYAYPSELCSKNLWGGFLLAKEEWKHGPIHVLRRNCNGQTRLTTDLPNRADPSSLRVGPIHWLLTTWGFYWLWRYSIGYFQSVKTLSSYQRVFLMVITLSWQPTSSTRGAPGSWSTLGLVQPQIVQQDGLAQHTVHPIYGRFQLGGLPLTGVLLWWDINPKLLLNDLPCLPYSSTFGMTDQDDLYQTIL